MTFLRVVDGADPYRIIEINKRIFERKQKK